MLVGLGLTELCDADTMFAHMEIPDTVVNQRLFGAFPDPLFAGKINFSAFACQLWHFLSFNTKW